MTGRRWLLIPMQPTPNGRLHIGHGAGPYLRADIIARALRRNGDDVAVITGSDAYENWVSMTALSLGMGPADTCSIYHSEIKRDLDYLGVSLDDWIDPLSVEHSRDYIELHDSLLREACAAGAARLERERVPVGQRTGQMIIGPWIAGSCPTCSAPCAGNTCTKCGDHFQPEEIVKPRYRIDEPVEWEEHSNWFVQPTDTTNVLAALRSTGLRDAFLRPARTYLDRRKARIRLSQPGDWGIVSREAPAGSVLSNTYYAYSLYCGEVYKRSRGLSGHNALDKDSGVIVVGLFGTDNSIAGLVAPHVLAKASKYKPFDHTVVNHMLYLEGRKCSTSKRHGIWISELIENTDITSDELRYCLAQIPLDDDVGNVTVSVIANRVNRVRQWRSGRLVAALATATTRISHRLLKAINDRVDRQNCYLIPPTVDLAAATHEMDEWLFVDVADCFRPDEAYTWLVGVALVAAPIMPRLAAELWSTLGMMGLPERTRLGDRGSAQFGGGMQGTRCDLEPRGPLDSANIIPYVHLEQ